MKKFKIVDMTNKPDDLLPGDMVKLRKGLRVYKNYGRYGGISLLKCMRYRGYETIKRACMCAYVLCNDFMYTSEMFDLTCVKRPIKMEELN